MSSAHRFFFEQIWSASGGTTAPNVIVTGTDGLHSAFAVSDLATASVAAAAAAIANYAKIDVGTPVTVDRRLCCLWFRGSIRPQGWTMPPAWDAVAGDYRSQDGWIRLHTNAPHHRAAALSVLGVSADRDDVAQAVRGWSAEALESAIVASGGCAAAMRSKQEWAAHPQGGSVAAEPLIARQRAPAGDAQLAGTDPARPLAGVRVLDLTRVLAGPVATRFLAGFGAEVLRIDPPFWNEPPIEPDLTLGKRCARLDLRDDTAREWFRTLLSQADVIVHGYRPDALEQMGLGEAERHRLRPGLVDVCLDAYGWSGPWSGRRGFDSLVQMSSGIAEAGMAWAGTDHPTPLPVQALDHATGYILAAAAIRGLTDRRRDGTGSIARISLARTAALLTARPGQGAETLGALTEADIAPGIEHTAWGPARRLRPPLAMPGIAMRWDHPATSLGSSPAEWSSVV